MRVFEVCEFDPTEMGNASKANLKDIRSDREEQSRYPKNVSKTGKYNLVTFLPKTLFYQFKKYTNIYFALLIVPSFFNIISAYEWSTEIPPFIFIMAVALLRELIEDVGRHHADSR